MRKISSIILSAILCAVSICSVACGEQSGTQSASETTDNNYSYYQSFTMNPEKKLYVFDSAKLTTAEQMTAVALQGLYAQRFTCRYYNLTNSENNRYWLNHLQDYGISYEYITLDEMIAAYIQDFAEDSGYVLYDTSVSESSIGNATTVCGVTGYLPITPEQLTSYEQKYPLEVKTDVREMTAKACFEAYKDKLNNKGLGQMEPAKVTCRDYLIANRLFCFYEDSEDGQTLNFRKTVHQWVAEDSPLFGWGPISEESFVSMASLYGQFTIPCSECYNLTVFSCRDVFGFDSIKQPYQTTSISAQTGKHYVCLVQSDGDNIGRMENFIYNNDLYFDAERGDFPYVWTISSSLIDLMPNVLKYYYDNARETDSFVASVSGCGYFNPGYFPQEALATHLEHVGSYMKRADLKYLQILDNSVSSTVVEAYSKISGLQGVMCMVGSEYDSNRGKIMWSENGIPFVSCRISLRFKQTAEVVAEKINSYDRDPTKIDGYTLVNVHAWSGWYSSEVRRLVNLLDDDVVIVNADQFFTLIKENVSHTDATPSKW
jgi:hypothetical protein